LPTVVDISKLEPGQMIVPVWRKQPIYVVRRTPDMVSRLTGHDGLLKDAASAESEQPDYAKNVTRSRKADILVLIGVCTHLGCLPKQRFAAAGEMGPTWPGGFFCPCHGSRFDLSGRVLNGSPASVNLRVPRYEFPNPQTLRIGADEQGEA
jgi:ubiquinol-cytochrome c reductase iron-sulfur subunit